MSLSTPVPGVGIELFENFQDVGKVRNEMPKETRKGECFILMLILLSSPIPNRRTSSIVREVGRDGFSTTCLMPSTLSDNGSLIGMGCTGFGCIEEGKAVLDAFNSSLGQSGKAFWRWGDPEFRGKSLSGEELCPVIFWSMLKWAWPDCPPKTVLQ